MLLVALTVLAASLPAAAATPCALTDQEELGRQLFFDKRLSEPAGQACATCHAPQVGFTGPSALINATIAIYPGAVRHRFGNRRPPTAAYATTAPTFHLDEARSMSGTRSPWRSMSGTRSPRDPADLSPPD